MNSLAHCLSLKSFTNLTVGEPLASTLLALDLLTIINCLASYSSLCTTTTHDGVKILFQQKRNDGDGNGEESLSNTSRRNHDQEDELKDIAGLPYKQRRKPSSVNPTNGNLSGKNQDATRRWRDFKVCKKDDLWCGSDWSKRSSGTWSLKCCPQRLRGNDSGRGCNTSLVRKRIGDWFECNIAVDGGIEEQRA